MTDETSDIQRLLDIMARLRDPQCGCPWDRQQTFATIAPYTIEEAYEVADAIDRNDLPALKDELGDLLLQVVFHARMAQELGAFAFGDVAAAISDKMQRRHPQVFDGVADEGADQTAANGALGDAQAQTAAWERHKRAEREAVGDDDTSALAGIARGVPEWQRALKLQQRAARVGFDWPDAGQVIAKAHEEVEEIAEVFAECAARDTVGEDAAAAAAIGERLEEEIGDLLFVCVNLARRARTDPGSALRRANRKFERRFRLMEHLAAADRTRLADLPVDAQERYWTRAKASEKPRGEED